MEREFLDYTEALELKELGFDKPCFAFFNGKHLSFARFDILGNPLDICNCLEAPTYSQAFRWFREKYDINNGICYSRLENNDWYYQYYKSALIGGFKIYEEAELACLKKLIEIVKEK